MTWAKATLYLLMSVLLLVAAGLYALYQVSAIGFGVALGAVATMLLGTFFMLALAVAVRIVNGGGRRSSVAHDLPPTVAGQYRELPPPAPVYLDPAMTWPVDVAAPLPRHDA